MKGLLDSRITILEESEEANTINDRCEIPSPGASRGEHRAKAGCNSNGSSADARAGSSLEQFSGNDSVDFPADHPLREASGRIVAVSGIDDHEAALLVAAHAVGAAAGPSCELEFLGDRINSSLNAWLIGGASLSEAQFINAAFSRLRGIMHGDVEGAQSQKVVAGLVRNTIAELRRWKGQESELRQKLNEKLHFLSDEDREKYVEEAVQVEKSGGYFLPGSGQELASEYGDARIELSRAEEGLGRSARLLRPLALIEGVCPEDVRSARRYALQNSLALVGVAGDEVIRLLHASKPKRKQVADAVRASFDNVVEMVDGKVQSAPWTSITCRLREELLSPLFRDSVIQDGGLLTRSIFIDLLAAQKRERDLSSCLKGDSVYNQIIGSRYRWQSEGLKYVFRLSEEAAAEYERFCTELDELFVGSIPLRPWLEMWPKMVLKLALLLHTASAVNVPTVISAESVRAAGNLLRRVGGKGLLRVMKWGLLRPPEEYHQDTQVKLLVAKVKMRGPLTRRELARCYHRMKMDKLEGLLVSAIEAGMVRMEQGVISAVESGECNN